MSVCVWHCEVCERQDLKALPGYVFVIVSNGRNRNKDKRNEEGQSGGGTLFGAFSASEVHPQQQQQQQECRVLPLSENTCSKVDTCYLAEENQRMHQERVLEEAAGLKSQSAPRGRRINLSQADRAVRAERRLYCVAAAQVKVFFCLCSCHKDGRSRCISGQHGATPAECRTGGSKKPPKDPVGRRPPTDWLPSHWFLEPF